MLRTYGAFSRHLPKGAIRIGAVSDQNEILVSAYNTDKGQVAVILNQGVIVFQPRFRENSGSSIFEVTTPYKICFPSNSAILTLMP